VAIHTAPSASTATSVGRPGRPLADVTFSSRKSGVSTERPPASSFAGEGSKGLCGHRISHTLPWLSTAALLNMLESSSLADLKARTSARAASTENKPSLVATQATPSATSRLRGTPAVVMTAFNQSEAMMIAPSVVAEDQRIVEDSVTVASVYMTVPGWLVIHTEVDGKPGPVIGHTALPQGESKDIKVEIDESDATSTLFAMLHVDEGVIGTYEFPGADAPVKDGDMIVMVPFSTEYQY